MRAMLFGAFFNLGIVPYLTLALLSTLPPGRVWLFRSLALVLLALANFGWWRVWRAMRAQLPAEHSGERPGIWLPLLLGAIGTALILQRVGLEPYGWWDTWAMWNAKGRDYSGAFLKGLDFELIRYTWVSYEYVTFFPLQLAFLAVLAGGWHIAVPVGLALSYYWLVVFLLYACLSSRSPAAILLLAGAALLPYLVNLASDQCADLPLAAIFAFCIYLYFLARRTTPTDGDKEGRGAPAGPTALLCFFVPSLALIKTEGAIMAGGIALFWLLDRRRARLTRAGILAGLLPLAFFFFYKFSAGKFHHLAAEAGDLSALLLDPARYLELAARFVEFHVLLVLGLPLVLAFVALRKNPRAIFYFIPIVVPLVLYHAIFLVTPIEQNFHLDTAYVRITAQFYPAFFLVIARILRDNQKIAKNSSAPLVV